MRSKSIKITFKRIKNFQITFLTPSVSCQLYFTFLSTSSYFNYTISLTFHHTHSSLTPSISLSLSVSLPSGLSPPTSEINSTISQLYACILISNLLLTLCFSSLLIFFGIILTLLWLVRCP